MLRYPKMLVMLNQPCNRLGSEIEPCLVIVHALAIRIKPHPIYPLESFRHSMLKTKTVIDASPNGSTGIHYNMKGTKPKKGLWVYPKLGTPIIQ